MKKEIKTLTIDRSKWLHGEGPDRSRLLRELDGKMCCLGFLGLACGATKRQIRCKSNPNDVLDIHWPKKLNYKTRLMIINDQPETNTLKEKKIKKAFKNELDINVKFVGRY